ncbi:hypothetical protein [Mycolicibacterium fortuitum]|uniref:hypothetical protein n=1 Tax=Mycolicibacterium fortuitum TaxID=1766 RepID=UPI003AAC86AC
MTLHEATSADAALATLRAEIERLAAAAAAATIRTKPLRVEISGRHPNEYSTEIWYEDSTFRVITCDGSVGLAGGRGRGLDWWPDFNVIEPEQMREIVSALLSAHEWAVSHPARHIDDNR